MKLSKLIVAIAAVVVIGVAQSAYATKTAPQLPIQITASATTVKSGDVVNYLIHVPNKSSSSYWGVVVTVNFPDTLNCVAVTQANLGTYTLVGNRFSATINDLHDWKVADWRIQCVTKPDAPCGGTISTTALLNVGKPVQTNSSTVNVSVACMNPTATPTPVSTYTPYVFPSSTPTTIPTYTPTTEPTSTPVVPTATSTPVPVVTATSTPTPLVTATPTSTPVVTATPTPTPSGECQTYSILRQVKSNYQRTLVTIKESVKVLPDGKSLTCFNNILNERSAACLTYGHVSLPDQAVQTQLRSESAAGACFGMSQLTYSLLNQACTLDDESDECEQFLALNLLRSNELPQPHTAAGICLGREHNPRFQEIIIDKDCRIIFHPTWEQEDKACPAAVISTTLYSYGKDRKWKWW
jgi:Domain of unknown function DUF11